MRVIVSLELEKPQLPKDYRPIFVSFLKNVLTTYNKDLAQKYYNENDPIMKSFTFAVLFRKPAFTEKTITLQDTQISLILSSHDLKDSMILYNAIITNQKTNFPLPEQNNMKILDIKIPRFSEIKTTQTIIKMISPIAIRQHDKETNKDIYLDYNSENFSEETAKIISWQLKNANLNENLTNGFSITPVMPKRTVVTSFNCNINANLGVYKLTGHPDLLNFLYLGGIGSRRNQGFGAFNIIA